MAKITKKEIVIYAVITAISIAMFTTIFILINKMKKPTNNLGDKSLPRGYRNNNPLNIRISSSNWKGKVSPNTDGAFEQFENMAFGFRAALKLLQNYIKNGNNTIAKMINRWAPATENHTENYINRVVKESGTSADAIIDVADKSKLCKIAYAMAIVENGTEPKMSDIEAGWNLL